MSGSIEHRASFGFIRYASVWEDADVLCDALAPTAAGGRLLSIASAGDNALALLTLDPAEVVAADLSAPQLACVELRMAAFRRLEYAELLAFLGVAEDGRRAETYRGLRGELSDGARAFWDAHPEIVAGGIIHAGRFERYLRTFRTRILPLVHPRKRIERLRERRTSAEQAAFYAREWDTWRWRLLFRLFFSRAVMGRMGRDPAFFTHVEGTVGDRILARTRRALTDLPAHSNPYLAYIMTGNYPAEALPRYLRPEWFAAIRDRLGRVRLVQGAIKTAGDGPFDGYNLSDIFEYMPPAEHERCYAALVGRAAPGARLVYWNMLAPRSRPEALAGRVRPLRARRMHCTRATSRGFTARCTWTRWRERGLAPTVRHHRGRSGARGARVGCAPGALRGERAVAPPLEPAHRVDAQAGALRQRPGGGELPLDVRVALDGAGAGRVVRRHHPGDAAAGAAGERARGGAPVGGWPLLSRSPSTSSSRWAPAGPSSTWSRCWC
jgi:S-adenosylmethionine-diacylglycerol 3-amino-3-carboxypropyl transferase